MIRCVFFGIRVIGIGIGKGIIFGLVFFLIKFWFKRFLVCVVYESFLFKYNKCIE